MKKYETKTFSNKIFELDGISKRTIDEHLKLYGGYITKANELNEMMLNLDPDDFKKANQAYSHYRALKIEYTFAYGGIVNHELYFRHLGFDGALKTGKLEDQIVKDFGSFDNYLIDLKASAMAARGWVWTCFNTVEDRLFNYLGDAQNSYPVWGATPILALDVYEHAYFIDFGAARANYIEAFVKNINWTQIEENFSKIK